MGCLRRERQLREGDIISIDFGVVVDGYYGDAAITVPVGKVGRGGQSSVQGDRGIPLSKESSRRCRQSAVGHFSRDPEYVEARGFSVVREFVGHGIGQQLHESPQIPNYGPPARE